MRKQNRARDNNIQIRWKLFLCLCCRHLHLLFRCFAQSWTEQYKYATNNYVVIVGKITGGSKNDFTFYFLIESTDFTSFVSCLSSAIYRIVNEFSGTNVCVFCLFLKIELVYNWFLIIFFNHQLFTSVPHSCQLLFMICLWFESMTLKQFPSTTY